MKRFRLGIVFLGVAPVFFQLFFAESAHAIPAFARKYKTSCVLYHAPIPRLTAMGEAFRLNGYKMPQADEIYVKEEPISMGAEAYKKVFPNAIWPSSLPGMPPLSIRAVGDVTYHPFGPQSSRSDFNFPTEVVLIGAGSFGDDFAFFAHLGFENEDDATTTTSIIETFLWPEVTLAVEST